MDKDKVQLLEQLHRDAAQEVEAIVARMRSIAHEKGSDSYEEWFTPIFLRIEDSEIAIQVLDDFGPEGLLPVTRTIPASYLYDESWEVTFAAEVEAHMAAFHEMMATDEGLAEINGLRDLVRKYPQEAARVLKEECR